MSSMHENINPLHSC